jgi:hypothetical protein
VALLPEMIDHLLQLAEVRTGFVHQLRHSAAGCPRRRKGQTTSFQLSLSAIPRPEEPLEGSRRRTGTGVPMNLLCKNRRS